MSGTPVMAGVFSERMRSARSHTDHLFELLQPDALYSRPIPERHRLIFYLGHLEAFDWNLICRKTLGVASFSPSSTSCSNLALIRRLAKRPPISRPTGRLRMRSRPITDAFARRIDEFLAQAPEQIIQVALEHRLMHAETLAYLLHNLPYQEKIAPAPGSRNGARQLRRRSIEIPPGVATLGQKARRVRLGQRVRPSTGYMFRASASASTKLPTASISILCAKAPLRRISGHSTATGSIAACSPKFRCRSTRRSTSRTPRPPPTRAGPERRSPPKRSFIGPRYGTPAGYERPYPWGDAALRWSPRQF